MNGEHLINIWLEAIDSVPSGSWVPIAASNNLPKGVRGDTSLWSERFFAAAANPQLRTADTKISVHFATESAPDLLRYEFTLKSWQIEVFESNNFTLTRVTGPVAILTLDEDHRRELIHAVAETVLNLKDDQHHWRFQLPPKLNDDVLFSTNPNVDLLYLPQWTDRADGGIHRGVLYFLCYKKVLEILAYDDIKQWFDSEFRAKFKH